MIVHQATPNRAATRDTAASCRPTCSNAQSPARSVRHACGPGLDRAKAYGQHQTRSQLYCEEPYVRVI
jgi:hypothetical protein